MVWKDAGYTELKPNKIMNLNNFTIKGQEAIAGAQQVAFNNNNINIETEHLLKALLNDDDSPIEFLLKKNNVTMNLLESKLDEKASPGFRRQARASSRHRPSGATSIMLF